MNDSLAIVDYFSWLGSPDKIANFDCGHTEMNKSIKKLQTNPEDKKVLALVKGTDLLLGIITYSLVTTNLMQAGESPENRFPSLNIDYLAIDKNHQNKKYGTQLIMCALKMALTINSLVPIHGVHLEALEDAVEFYEKLGFTDLGHYYPGRRYAQMYYRMDKISKLGLPIYINPYTLE